MGFRFEKLSPHRAYFLKVTAVGFSPLQTEQVKPPFVFPGITLEESEAVRLNEVTIQGKKPMIENEIDRTIVNVEAMPGANTGNAYSLLEKTPGVNVTGNSISLNGKQNVSVMVNGRPTHLGGKDLENYLKSLSATDIEKIELIDNPPARYDASGGAIINLKLRLNRKAGWAASLNLSHNAGKYRRNYDGLSFNYNLGKVHAYASGGYFNERYEDVESRQTRFLKENYTVEQESVNTARSRGFSAHGGLDYFLSGKTTMGVFYRNSRPDAPSFRTVENRELLHPLTTRNDNREKKTYDGASAYFVQKLGKRELALEVNQVRYLNDAVQHFENIGQEEFRYVLDTRIRTRSAALDYTHPITKGRFEAGMKTTFMDNDNDNRYEDRTENGFNPDWSRSNHFQYHENINALYLSGQREFKRWSVKAGLRAETTHAEGLQLGNEAVPESGFKRSYVNLFHNLFLNYKLDSAGKNTLSFITLRRLVRPYYLYLNPFMQYRDSYNYTTGNPELDPQIQNRYELEYRYTGSFRIGFHYNPFKDVILPTTRTIDNVFYTQHDNIAEGYMYMLNVFVNNNFTKWWSFNYSARLAHVGLRGKVYVENLDYSVRVLRGS
ncbi:MAG: outer membrane beta-barrel protein [Leadbetterella sp.]|nr:outer membrane beta-barrel protein [Leadbetterella sp.]